MKIILLATFFLGSSAMAQTECYPSYSTVTEYSNFEFSHGALTNTNGIKLMSGSKILVSFPAEEYSSAHDLVYSCMKYGQSNYCSYQKGSPGSNNWVFDAFFIERSGKDVIAYAVKPTGSRHGIAPDKKVSLLFKCK